jgi:alpha-1,6-mannosyltransferase
LTGLFLGLAIFTKFYPAVLFPALYTRRDWKMPAAIAAVGVVGYSLYSSAGKLMLGFLSGYQQEEGMNTGARYFLLQMAQKVPGLHSLSVAAYMLFCVLVFGLLIVWAWREATIEVVPLPPNRATSPVFLRVAMALAFAMMLLFSPHYPWYVLWLIPFMALVPNLPLVAYVVGLFYLLTTALADGTAPKMFLLNERLYECVLATFLLGWAVSRWRLARHFILPGRG